MDAVHYRLPQPFWVVATQNPLFQSGTYALPESQLDRFLMRLSLGYPSRSAERALLTDPSRQSLLSELPEIFSAQDLLALQQLRQQIEVSDAVLDYILDLAEKTRTGLQGLSTRGVIALKNATQAYAMIQQRAFATTDDVQAVFAAVVAHRIGLSELETQQLMQRVPVSY